MAWSGEQNTVVWKTAGFQKQPVKMNERKFLCKTGKHENTVQDTVTK